MAKARVVSLYRHPVKGLRPEVLDSARVSAGRGLEGDRAFAFQFLDESVPAELRAAPEENAPWMFKAHLAVQHDWPDLALIEPLWKPDTCTLALEVADGTRVEESVVEPEGRARLAAFVHGFLSRRVPYEKARHGQLAPLRLVGNADLSTRYTDGGGAPLSFALRESLVDLEEKYGFPVDERRFRLNFFLEGAPAWSELGWQGHRLRVGDCVFEVRKPIGRCPNIDVDPDTGERKDEIFPRMKEVLGHSVAGMRCDLVSGSGNIGTGDDWEVLSL
jgi:uncharacterized protein YcbX